MIEIFPLQQLHVVDFKRVATGYSSECKYVVEYSEKEGHILFDLQHVKLSKPSVKKWEHDDNMMQNYQQMLRKGYSFAAYDDNLLVGVLIAEPREWNGSLWVWEFHVAETSRHQGIGKRLMDCVIEKAKADHFRTVVCETQNTNGVAMQVYRKLGFRVEGIDISCYSNHDYPDGEIAIFMKRRLQ